MDEEESAAFRGFRWWSVKEITESDAAFAPRELGALLVRLRLRAHLIGRSRSGCEGSLSLDIGYWVFDI
jgi:hypothetical protein